jgi:uncharacterized protein
LLIILPPSETKRPPPASGRPVDLGALSFPELRPVRERILAALVETSAGSDALRRLLVRPVMAEEVARNTALRDLPAMAAGEVYAGPLYQGLDAPTLSAAGAARADRSLVVTSALWGALRLSDRIPPYRMHVCSRLVGMDRLEPTWRTVLPDTLARAAGDEPLIVDFRSPQFQAIGMPTGLGARTLVIGVAQGSGRHRLGDVIAKRVRGEAVRLLLESGAHPNDPDELATILSGRWSVFLSKPTRADRPGSLTLGVDG